VRPLVPRAPRPLRDLLLCPRVCPIRRLRADCPTQPCWENLNVQREFRRVLDAAGLTGREWTPRELRQSFVSLLSDEKVPVEVISRLVGHRSTTVTETVYRKQLRPVIEGIADVMDRLFPSRAEGEA
jgi:integrase